MIFTNRHLIISVCGFLFCAMIAGCKGNDGNGKSAEGTNAKAWSRSDAETEYELIQAEMKLAKTKATYLVLDLTKNKLLLKLQGAVVWDYPLQLDEKNSDNMNKFAEHFIGNDGQLIRPVLEKHLFAAKDKSSDSVLAIVSGVVRAEVDLMQREVPERFQILWDDDLIMDVRSEVVGQPRSKFQNTMVELRQALERPFGEARIIIKMDSEHALTLYRATKRGLPTLIYPSK